MLYPEFFLPKGGGQNKGFHSGPIMWVSYFGLWVAGPHNFPCCVGWVPLPFQKATDSPFSSKSHTFGRLPSIFYPHFSSFCTMYPNFGSFYASGFFIDPQCLLYLSFGLLVAPQCCYCPQEVVASGRSYHQKLGPWRKPLFRHPP